MFESFGTTEYTALGAVIVFVIFVVYQVMTKKGGDVGGGGSKGPGTKRPK